MRARQDMEIRVRPPGPVLSPPPLLQAPTSNLPPPPIISSSPTAYSLMPLWSASSFPPISDVPSIVIVSNSVNAFAIQTFRNGSLSGRSIHVYHSHCRVSNGHRLSPCFLKNTPAVIVRLFVLLNFRKARTLFLVPRSCPVTKAPWQPRVVRPGMGG